MLKNRENLAARGEGNDWVKPKIYSATRYLTTSQASRGTIQSQQPVNVARSHGRRKTWKTQSTQQQQRPLRAQKEDHNHTKRKFRRDSAKSFPSAGYNS